MFNNKQKSKILLNIKFSKDNLTNFPISGLFAFEQLNFSLILKIKCLFKKANWKKHIYADLHLRIVE